MDSDQKDQVIAMLAEALGNVIGDLEHEEPDGWMSGNVSVDACRSARVALALVAAAGKLEGGR